MRVRLLTATAVAAGLAICAVPSSAATAPAPQITDPTGDGYAPMAGMDIVSALFATTGKGTPGKKGYVPTALTIAVTYAGAVTTDPGAEQEVHFTSPSCGAVSLQAFGGSTYGSADCLAASFQPAVVVNGSTLTFTVPLAAIDGLKRRLTESGVPITEAKALSVGTHATVAWRISGRKP